MDLVPFTQGVWSSSVGGGQFPSEIELAAAIHEDLHRLAVVLGKIAVLSSDGPECHRFRVAVAAADKGQLLAAQLLFLLSGRESSA